MRASPDNVTHRHDLNSSPLTDAPSRELNAAKELFTKRLTFLALGSYRKAIGLKNVVFLGPSREPPIMIAGISLFQSLIGGLR